MGEGEGRTMKKIRVRKKIQKKKKERKETNEGRICIKSSQNHSPNKQDSNPNPKIPTNGHHLHTALLHPPSPDANEQQKQFGINARPLSPVSDGP